MTPKPLLFLLFVGLLSGGHAQAQFTGRVVDARTQQPVPYAALRMRVDSTGTLTNVNGHFTMSAPKKVGTDTLMVEALGYQSQAVAIHNQLLPDSIFALRQQPIAPQNETRNRGRVLVERLGAASKAPGQGKFINILGGQHALFMRPISRSKLGNIHSVAFYLAESGLPTTPFRIRIYRANGPKQSPGTNLLNESIIVQAPKGGQWFIVDLAKYNLAAPQEGFFVAMEWVAVNRDIKNFPGLDTNGMLVVSQMLRPTFEFVDARTWQFGLDKGWRPITATSNGIPYNAMIRADVEVLP